MHQKAGGENAALDIVLLTKTQCHVHHGGGHVKSAKTMWWEIVRGEDCPDNQVAPCYPHRINGEQFFVFSFFLSFEILCPLITGVDQAIADAAQYYPDEPITDLRDSHGK